MLAEGFWVIVVVAYYNLLQLQQKYTELQRVVYNACYCVTQSLDLHVRLNNSLHECVTSLLQVCKCYL